MEGEKAKLNQGNKVCRDGREQRVWSSHACHKVFFQRGASVTPSVCQEEQTDGIISYHNILHYITFYHIILRRRARSRGSVTRSNHVIARDQFTSHTIQTLLRNLQ